MRKAKCDGFWKVVIIVFVVIAFSYFVMDMQKAHGAYQRFMELGMEGSKAISVHPDGYNNSPPITCKVINESTNSLCIWYYAPEWFCNGVSSR